MKILLELSADRVFRFDAVRETNRSDGSHALGVRIVLVGLMMISESSRPADLPLSVLC